MDTKQVIVIRKDLKMRKGKIAAQAAHASMAFITKRWKKNKGVYKFIPTEEIEHWFSNSFAKICVYVESEKDLHKIYQLAIEANIPSSLIKDSGRTEFHGIPTYTCCAIGPAEVSKIDKITGALPLL
jgi:PTH2 family peptidyl-tRNA hydrolase